MRLVCAVSIVFPSQPSMLIAMADSSAAMGCCCPFPPAWALTSVFVGVGHTVACIFSVTAILVQGQRGEPAYVSIPRAIKQAPGLLTYRPKCQNPGQNLDEVLTSVPSSMLVRDRPDRPNLHSSPSASASAAVCNSTQSLSPPSPWSITLAESVMEH